MQIFFVIRTINLNEFSTSQNVEEEPCNAWIRGVVGEKSHLSENKGLNASSFLSFHKG